MRVAIDIVGGVTLPVTDVAEDEFESQVLEESRSRPVVVDFWAGWCQPCRVLGPVLERLAEEHDGRFLLAKVDVDANQGLAARYGVQGIPAVKAFRDGRVVAEFVGVQPEEVVRRWLRDLVPSEAQPIVADGVAAEERGELEAAEEAYARALEADPDLEEAGLGAARVALARGDAERARTLAERYPQNVEARRIAAAAALVASAPPGDDLQAMMARAEADPQDHEALLAVAAHEAGRGEHGKALDAALRVVASGGEHRERARDLIVSIFDVLGPEDPLVKEYRPRLASALF